MPCIPSHVGLIGKAWKTLLAFVLVVSLIPSSALANIELANVGDAATAAPQVQAAPTPGSAPTPRPPSRWAG